MTVQQSRSALCNYFTQFKNGIDGCVKFKLLSCGKDIFCKTDFITNLYKHLKNHHVLIQQQTDKELNKQKAVKVEKN